MRYRTNPPTSGDHHPVAAEDGIYDATPPPLGRAVHALEHGRMEVQHRAGASRATVRALSAATMADLDLGTPTYHALLFRNQTKMPHAVAATACRHALTCSRMNARVGAAVRAFRSAYTDKDAELIP